MDKSESVTPVKTSEFIQGMMDIGSSICTRKILNVTFAPLQKLNCLYNPKFQIYKFQKDKHKYYSYLLIVINSENMIYLKKINSGKLWLDLYAGPLFETEVDMIAWKSKILIV